MANCFAKVNPIFQRAMRLIIGITNEQVPTVTTSFSHNYETGDFVRFSIPVAYGIQQIMRNVDPLEITVTSSTTFTIPLDTSRFDPFIDASIASEQCAQVLPVGEISSKLTSATQNVL